MIFLVGDSQVLACARAPITNTDEQRRALFRRTVDIRSPYVADGCVRAECIAQVGARIAEIAEPGSLVSSAMHVYLRPGDTVLLLVGSNDARSEVAPIESLVGRVRKLQPKRLMVVGPPEIRGKRWPIHKRLEEECTRIGIAYLDTPRLGLAMAPDLIHPAEDSVGRWLREAWRTMTEWYRAREAKP